MQYATIISTLEVMTIIYLDNAATTKIKPEVLDAMMPWLQEEYGNPSGKYGLGLRAKEAIENARNIVAYTLGCDTDEIYFTSGATEGNNFVVDGFPDVITSPIEHHSILNCTMNPVLCEVNKVGEVNIDSLKPRDVNTAFQMVSIMFANNEIGTIQPIEEIGKLCETKKWFFHTDATQAYGHIPINVKKLGVDFLTASAHKFHGPKGVGFIYINKDLENKIGCKKDPDSNFKISCGGQQERNVRAGTENVPGIVGLGVAASLMHQRMRDISRITAQNRNYLYGSLSNKVPEFHINGTADWRKRIPNNLNCRFDGIKGEELLAFLDAHDICVSSGSSCDSDSGEPSHVLKAIGLSDEEAESSLRFSVDETIKRNDIDFVVDVIKKGIESLKR